MSIIYFKNDESGAVTADWVVLTSALVGISMAVVLLISNGVRDASNGIDSGLRTSWNFNFTIKDATDFFDIGIDAYPTNQTEAWRTARLAVHADAPDGYGYDPDLTTTFYVDDASGNPIYVSNDGTTFSIGGDIIDKDDYDTSGRTSFMSTFNQYWEANP